MSISITYSSRRIEVWDWYWRAWRRSLWRMHLLVFLASATGASLALFNGFPKQPSSFIGIMLIGITPLIALVIFPMIMFKPQMRTLSIDKSGIETRIGAIYASVPWQDVVDVRNEGNYLIIERTNRNAFIVPPRAFANVEAREQFCAFVTAMMQSKA